MVSNDLRWSVGVYGVSDGRGCVKTAEGVGGKRRQRAWHLTLVLSQVVSSQKRHVMLCNGVIKRCNAL